MTFDDLSRPPLDRSSLRTALLGCNSLWREVDVMVELPSTNAELVDRARRGAAPGTVLAVDFQSDGRGRRDRSWVAPPRSGLAFSFLLRPHQVPIERWAWMSLLVGLAVDAAVNAAGAPAALKWPNDVTVHGRKIAGILLERVDTPGGAALVAGIGLNVSTTREELPVSGATSLRLENADITDRSLLLRSCLRNVEALYRSWTASAGDPAGGIQSSYVRRCETLGQRVTIFNPDGSESTGLAEAIDEAGRRVVDGKPVSVGDVVHVRPAS